MPDLHAERLLASWLVSAPSWQRTSGNWSSKFNGESKGTMNTHPQIPTNVPGQPLRAIPPGHSRRQELDPEMITQVIGYGLMWLGMILFAVAVVAMAMERLL